jgi:hypothetical protein
MAAQIIPLSRPKKAETPSPLCPPLHAHLPASLTGAARLWWHRARLTVEALGWVVLATSVIAAVKT